MLTFDDIWIVFLPIIKFFWGLWDFFNTGVYDAFENLFETINPLAFIFSPIREFIFEQSGFAGWLNQFTVLEMTLGGGLIIVIILSIFGFFTDKVGL